jgi:hypothetical protein
MNIMIGRNSTLRLDDCLVVEEDIVNIGLDFIRDWEICLGLWILCGFASVFLNAFNYMREEHRMMPVIDTGLIFLEGPLILITFVAGMLAKPLRRRR